eukprot:CAMPEP_0195287276 /NCGR_PEP_ID=MMETSP0707-20130614/4405_1 /TAXON_ID=33640 /ORGANISM="Asterionellopsis glacialis, Strain CCMP134" /LENGTH=242 /DNA_ID=CAMNT_0040347017 /DNA_START=51 /DNA_END=779 /DNA_ORIENTATION=+
MVVTSPLSSKRLGFLKTGSDKSLGKTKTSKMIFRRNSMQDHMTTSSSFPNILKSCSNSIDTTSRLSSSLASLDFYGESEHDATKKCMKSCLKVKTQEESLHRNWLSTAPLPTAGPILIAPQDPQHSDSDAESSPTIDLKFSTVDVQEHSYELGDNPSVSSGAPLTIGWEPFRAFTMSVDDYESERLLHRSPSCNRIPKFDRDEILKEAGYSRSQLVEATKALQKLKKQQLKNSKKTSWFQKP